MRKLWTDLTAVAALVAIGAPMLGVALDHHFAERQHGHRHVVEIGPHTHLHAHAHQHAGSRTPGGAATAMNDYTAGPAGGAVVLNAELAVDALTLFEPASLIAIRPEVGWGLTSAPADRLDKPPQTSS